MEELLAQLEGAGFYKYTDPEQVEQAKAEQLASRSIWADYGELTRRFYSADGEELDEGGVLGFLWRVSPLLQRQGVYIGRLDQEWAGRSYHIHIDGRTYKIFSEEDTKRMGFRPAAVARTLHLAQDLLDRANSNEKVYTIEASFGGEASKAVFLTSELYDLIQNSPLVRREDKLMTLQEALRIIE